MSLDAAIAQMDRDDRRPDSVGVGVFECAGAGGRERGECTQGTNAAACSEAEGESRLAEEDGWSREFISEMRRVWRSGRGRRQRALPRPANIQQITNMAEIQRRLSLYSMTGEKGYLVDVALSALAEYVEPSQIPCGMNERHPGES